MKKMPEAWTGEVVGKMHVHKISQEQLARRVGLSRPHLSAVLNGSRNTNARERIEATLETMIAEQANAES